MRQFLTFLENIDKNSILVNFIKDGFGVIMENYYPDDDYPTLHNSSSTIRGGYRDEKSGAMVLYGNPRIYSTALDKFNDQSANMASENGLGVLSFLRNSEKSLSGRYSNDSDQELDDNPTNDIGVSGDLTVNIHIGKTTTDDSLGLSLARSHL